MLSRQITESGLLEDKLSKSSQEKKSSRNPKCGNIAHNQSMICLYKKSTKCLSSAPGEVLLFHMGLEKKQKKSIAFYYIWRIEDEPSLRDRV